MMHAKYTKYGILSGLLLICTIMSSVTADSQKSVFAQITPAAEKYGSNDVAATDSSHDTGATNHNSQGITPSAKSDETTTEEEEEEGSTESNNSNDVNSGQTATDQVDKTTTTEEQDPDPASQLAEAIMSDVNEALSASGIYSP
jgi:hypothetical protein